MTAFSAMIDTLFTDANIAQDAVYSSTGATVRVIVKAPDRRADVFDAGVVDETAVLEVRVSEVPAPAAGQTFTLGGVIYIVQGRPRRDSLGLVWTVETDGGEDA